MAEKGGKATLPGQGRLGHDDQMKAGLCVRPARADELDSVAQVWHASASAADDAPPQMPTVQELRARIDAELAYGWELSVALVGDAVVGMLAVSKDERVLDELYIAPSMQRKGVGKLLLRRAMEEMPTGFTLRTSAINVGARAFYERMGLRLLSEGAHPRHGHPVCFYGWDVG